MTARPTPGYRRPRAAGERHGGGAEQHAEDDGDHATGQPAQRAPAWCASQGGRSRVSAAAHRLHAVSSGRLRRRRSVDRMPTDPPATLAAWLRTRSDEQLSALLVARPDVARPAPSDVVALASRLAVPVSVDRALDELDAATLQVLDVVLLAQTDGVAPGRPGRGAARRARTTSSQAVAGPADRRGRCCGATTCCARPTRCAAASATRRVSAAGRPSCGSSCRPTCAAELAELDRRRARGARAAGR